MIYAARPNPAGLYIATTRLMLGTASLSNSSHFVLIE